MGCSMSSPLNSDLFVELYYSNNSGLILNSNIGVLSVESRSDVSYLSYAGSFLEHHSVSPCPCQKIRSAPTVLPYGAQRVA